MTYVWFQSLRSLLYLFQRLTASSMWKMNSGFLSGDPVNICPYTQDTQHFIDLIQEYDAAQLLTWGRDRLQSSQSFCQTTAIQPSHFKRNQDRLHLNSPIDISSSDKKTDTKNLPLKRQREQSAPDFVAAQPLFELVNPPKESRGMVTIFTQASPPNAAKPALPAGPDGKSVLICFASSCGAPFNTCNTTVCHAGRSRRIRKGAPIPPAFSYVDLAVKPWASKPEVFWEQIVTWLQLPGVSLTVRPSAFFKAKRSSTTW